MSQIIQVTLETFNTSALIYKSRYFELKINKIVFGNFPNPKIV